MNSNCALTTQHLFLRLAVALVALAWSNIAFCGEIHEAASSGTLRWVKGLVNKKPDLVNEKNEYGWTPLFYAAQSGHNEVVEFLLLTGADVNARDSTSKETPLLWAVRGESCIWENEKNPVIELLLAYKADPNAQDSDGKTPLHSAASSRTVELLLAQHADVNIKDSEGNTPLLAVLSRRQIWSCPPTEERVQKWLKNQRNIVQLLLDSKSDVNTKNKNGTTPLRQARGNKDLADLLRAHGAKE